MESVWIWGVVIFPWRKTEWLLFVRVLRQEYIKLLPKIQRSIFCQVFCCILWKLFMSQRDTCKSKTFINKKAKWTSFSLFFIHEYKSLLVPVFGGGKVVLIWPAKYFLAREFRFNMWRKFVLNLPQVHLLVLCNTILSSCWKMHNKSYVLQREKMKLSLHFFRAQSEWFIHGKSEDSRQNGQ